MPALKPISGHSKSVRAAILYLTGKERALAADFVNCREVDRHGKPVWQQMDEKRHALGCDVPTQGHKNVRTYEHFVLSPDPRDDVDLAILRELATEWAREYFGSHQVAIYYHDDNEGRIPHAHLIVNNANLERPGRVSTILTPQFEREIFKGLQRMAAERGLHAFTERATSVNNAEWAKADEKRALRERPKGTVQPTYRSKQDRELEAKGISWKRDVHDSMARLLLKRRRIDILWPSPPLMHVVTCVNQNKAASEKATESSPFLRSLRARERAACSSSGTRWPRAGRSRPPSPSFGSYPFPRPGSTSVGRGSASNPLATLV